jgi:hypothetical protein
MKPKPLAAMVLAACTLGAAHAALPVGAPAPVFTAEAALGGRTFTFSLAEALREGPVVLYFYPKAFTSGCTIEAHAFAEATPQFQALGARVIGMSADDIATLQQQVPGGRRPRGARDPAVRRGAGRASRHRGPHFLRHRPAGTRAARARRVGPVGPRPQHAAGRGGMAAQPGRQVRPGFRPGPRPAGRTAAVAPGRTTAAAARRVAPPRSPRS